MSSLRTPTTRDVVVRWLKGERGIGGSGNLTSDGQTLYSYMVPIAVRAGEGTIRIVVDRYWSRATKRHVRLVEAVARSHGFQVDGREGA